MEAEDKESKSAVIRFGYYLGNLVDRHCTWIRETIFLPYRKQYYWYHEKIKRVPTIDECYIDDELCIYEAEEQYKRDRRVDRNILQILRKRWEHCLFDNPMDSAECTPLYESYFNSVTNYFIKYGDLGMRDSSISCLMKQKHRMAWERRHGPVGSGRRKQPEELPPKNDDV